MTEATGNDVSETGIAFTGPVSFPAGTELTVHFRLGASSTASWTRTRVIVRNIEQQGGGNYRFGAEFSIIHPRDRVELRQLTASIKNAD